MGINRFGGHARVEVTTVARGVIGFNAPDLDNDCVNWNVDRDGHLNIFETLDFADERTRVNTKIATIPTGQWLDVHGLADIPEEGTDAPAGA